MHKNSSGVCDLSFIPVQYILSAAALTSVYPLKGTLAQAVKKGQWILLDEINLAAAETLECLSGLLEGSAGSLVLLDRGDTGEDCCHAYSRVGL